MVNCWHMGGRRSRIQIAANILKASYAKDNSESELRKSVNMNHQQTQKYTTWLAKLQLLNIVKTDEICICYRSTLKGQSLVSVIEEIEHILGENKTR